MLELSRIRAVSIDLDDTLWPVWPTIERAERALQDWLRIHAPDTAKLHESVATRQAIRARLDADRPELRHDFSALRLESIRIALLRAEEDPALAEAMHALTINRATRDQRRPSPAVSAFPEFSRPKGP